jgi:hypothetical protein
VSAAQLFGVTAVHGRRGAFAPGTESVVFRDLAAIVAEAPEDRPGELSLADYRRVVESVFREQAVLPAPPGVVFRDREVLLHWLELHYFTLLDALAFVEDRAVARVAVARDGAEPGAAAAADEAAELVLHDALRVLRRHAAATLTIGTDGGGHVTAASFLVERTRWDAFAEMVERENARLTDVALSLSGPWPPYDFVRMQFSN